jgi:hypothetical protein
VGPPLGTVPRGRSDSTHNRAMLRLDPAHPPLWRTARCLQFGVADVARLDDPEPWEERLVDQLERGMTEADVAGMLRAERIAPERADALFAELQPVLRRVAPPPRVRVHAAGDLDEPAARCVAEALTRAGADVRASHGPPARDDDGRVVVLVGAHLIAPHRAAALVSVDRAHLPIVFDGGGATVGPLVVPGETGCLACAALHARDADPAWPLLATQLLGRACEPDPDVAVEAARVAVMVLSEPDGPSGRSVRLRTDSPQRAWRSHPPHEECACRSLAGTATEHAAPVRALVPSSPRAFARPA